MEVTAENQTSIDIDIVGSVASFQRLTGRVEWLGQRMKDLGPIYKIRRPV